MQTIGWRDPHTCRSIFPISPTLKRLIFRPTITVYRGSDDRRRLETSQLINLTTWSWLWLWVHHQYWQVDTDVQNFYLRETIKNIKLIIIKQEKWCINLRSYLVYIIIPSSSTVITVCMETSTVHFVHQNVSSPSIIVHISNKSQEIHRNFEIIVQGQFSSRSSKVIDLGANRKRISNATSC